MEHSLTEHEQENDERNNHNNFLPRELIDGEKGWQGFRFRIPSISLTLSFIQLLNTVDGLWVT